MPIPSRRRSRRRPFRNHEHRYWRPALDESHLRLPTLSIVLSLFLATLQFVKATITLLVVINGNTGVAVRDARVAAAKLDQALHNRPVDPSLSRNNGGSEAVEPNLCQLRRADRPQIAKMDVIDPQRLYNTADILRLDTSSDQCLQKTLKVIRFWPPTLSCDRQLSAANLSNLLHKTGRTVVRLAPHLPRKCIRRITRERAPVKRRDTLIKIALWSMSRAPPRSRRPRLAHIRLRRSVGAPAARWDVVCTQGVHMKCASISRAPLHIVLAVATASVADRVHAHRTWQVAVTVPFLQQPLRLLDDFCCHVTDGLSLATSTNAQRTLVRKGYKHFRRYRCHYREHFLSVLWSVSVESTGIPATNALNDGLGRRSWADRLKHCLRQQVRKWVERPFSCR